ncbi:MAG: hypothetical protein ACR65R_12570 [Methylomicrobium sp.]
MKKILMVSTASACLSGFSGSTYAAGYTAQSLNAPGPATRMSDNGTVAGFYTTKCETLNWDPNKPTICYRAPWVYDGQRFTKFGKQWPHNAEALPYDINDSLNLVGRETRPNPLDGGWTYSGGTVTYTATGGVPRAINNVGVIVGDMSSGSTDGYTSINRIATFQNGTPQAVLFKNPLTDPTLSALYTYLSALTTTTYAVDINDDDLIAGWYKGADNTEHGFVVNSGGTVTVIPNLPGSANCRPVRISQAYSNPADPTDPDNGNVWVVGNCDANVASAGKRPFLYEINSGILSELTFPDRSQIGVVSVNSQGEAVGYASKPGVNVASDGTFPADGYTAVKWSVDGNFNITPTDLNANQAFTPATARYVQALDISEIGTILTRYNDATTYNFQAVLLYPIP